MRFAPTRIKNQGEGVKWVSAVVEVHTYDPDLTPDQNVYILIVFFLA